MLASFNGLTEGVNEKAGFFAVEESTPLSAFLPNEKAGIDFFPPGVAENVNAFAVGTDCIKGCPESGISSIET